MLLTILLYHNYFHLILPLFTNSSNCAMYQGVSQLNSIRNNPNNQSAHCKFSVINQHPSESTKAYSLRLLEISDPSARFLILKEFNDPLFNKISLENDNIFYEFVKFKLIFDLINVESECFKSIWFYFNEDSKNPHQDIKYVVNQAAILRADLTYLALDAISTSYTTAVELLNSLKKKYIFPEINIKYYNADESLNLFDTLLEICKETRKKITISIKLMNQVQDYKLLTISIWGRGEEGHFEYFYEILYYSRTFDKFCELLNNKNFQRGKRSNIYNNF